MSKLHSRVTVIMACAIFLSFFSLQTMGQSFLHYLQAVESGKGLITIKQDPSLNYLIDNNTPVVVVDTLPTITNVPIVVAKTRRLKYDTLWSKPKMPEFSVHSRRVTGDSLSAISSSKKILTNTKKVTGYRVQLYAGGNTREDRQKAEAIGRKAKRLFPHEPIYTHFYSPRWVCRMGNYEDYGEAQAALKKARHAGITGACLIKGKISVKKDD